MQSATGEDIGCDGREVRHGEWGSADGREGILVGKNYLQWNRSPIDSRVVVVLFARAGV